MLRVDLLALDAGILDGFMKWLNEVVKLESLEDIPENQYERVFNKLGKSIAAREKKDD